MLGNLLGDSGDDATISGRNLLIIIAVALMGLTGMSGFSQYQESNDREQSRELIKRIEQLSSLMERSAERQTDILRRLDAVDTTMDKDGEGMDGRWSMIEKNLALMARDDVALDAALTDLFDEKTDLRSLIGSLDRHIQELGFEIESLRAQPSSGRYTPEPYDVSG